MPGTPMMLRCTLLGGLALNVAQPPVHDRHGQDLEGQRDRLSDGQADQLSHVLAAAAPARNTVARLSITVARIDATTSGTWCPTKISSAAGMKAATTATGSTISALCRKIANAEPKTRGTERRSGMGRAYANRRAVG